MPKMKHALVPILFSLLAGAMPAHAWADQRSDRRENGRDRDRNNDDRGNRGGNDQRDDDHRGDYRRGDQYEAYQARRSGNVMSLRDIERRVVPSMPGASYLGPEFDRSSGTYRLKFMRRGNVTWVDIDGRTGAVIGRSGN